MASESGEESFVAAPFDHELLNREPASICALDATLEIAFVNVAWCEFARANGGDPQTGAWLGVSVMSAIPDVLRPFYGELFERVRRSREPREHSYECSTPNLFRRFRMRVLPCERDALLVVHSLLHASPHEEEGFPALEGTYRDAQGILKQCSHCRRVRRCDGTGGWDWVPGYVEHVPVATSHGLCPICARHYFGA